MSEAIQKNKKEKKYKFFDYTLLFIIIFLVGFGLVMLYSTSSYTAAIKYGNSAYFLRKQMKAAMLGFSAMLFFSFVDYHFWMKLSFVAYVVSFALCLYVLIGGKAYNGSTRWIYIGGMSVQPSEIAKIAIIIFLAAVINKIPKKMDDWRTIVKLFAFVIPITGVIALNNLSTAIIILGITFVIIFVSSPKYLPFVMVIAIGVALSGGFLLTAGYRLERIKIWLHPEDYSKGYQILQGLYAIGSGGLFGKGLGESMQKLGYLPEAQNDMIFSIICEELGLFGAICVILLYLLLLWRFMVIATNANDLYGALIVSGILAHIAIQVILNIAVVTNTIPNTGITLPFISYGGTSVSILLAEMGLALNVAKQIKLTTSE
ncbi:MAG: putative lipid II flippase FtsW [Lachnospiraceae bacterium]|nr:putative lipid II flippase FtsW [Lachnospiraceae bacterium]